MGSESGGGRLYPGRSKAELGGILTHRSRREDGVTGRRFLIEVCVTLAGVSAGKSGFADVPAIVEGAFQLGQLAVLNLHGGGVDVLGALAFGAVHQGIGPVD